MDHNIDKDGEREIFRLDIRNPYLVSVTILLVGGILAGALWSIAWDAYRPVNGVVTSKHIGWDGYYYLEIEEDGARYEKEVPLDIYIRSGLGDRVTKKAGFFEPIKSSGVERHRQMMEKLKKCPGLESNQHGVINPIRPST